jgi:hypothetical protein
MLGDMEIRLSVAGGWLDHYHHGPTFHIFRNSGQRALHARRNHRDFGGVLSALFGSRYPPASRLFAFPPTQESLAGARSGVANPGFASSDKRKLILDRFFVHSHFATHKVVSGTALS